jgi:hypothetical protein
MVIVMVVIMTNAVKKDTIKKEIIMCRTNLC